MSPRDRPPALSPARSPVTSKRHKARRAETTPVAPAAATRTPTTDAAGPDALRRVLLVLLVVLLVARPLVRGEDPGQLSDLSDPGSLALTLLALAGAAGWAGWRLWLRRPVLYASLFEAGLFVLVLLYFLGSVWASYQRAAWLTAWEWLGMVLTVWLVRQLAARPADQSLVLGLLLAGAVALSAQGLYQAAFELPRRLEKAGPWPADHVRQELESKLLHPSAEELAVLTQQLERQQVSGPYFFPTSLAGCLVLLIPGLVGAVTICLRHRAPIWQTVLASLFALLAAIVLVLTRAWAVVAAGLLVGLLAAGLLWPRQRGGVWVGLSLALLLAGLFFWALLSFGKADGGGGVLADGLERWREVWPAAWQLLGERPWVGTGPSQFGLFYPRYQAETAGPAVSVPGSAPLDVWSDLGLPGLAAFVAVLALAGLALVRWWRTAGRQPAPPGEEPAEAAEDVVHWEYYLGGMIGLILAFALRAGSLSGAEIISETIVAGIGSVFWFAAFALYERLPFTAADRLVVLLLGSVALLVALLFIPGITFPSVAGLLWIALALLLATLTPAPAAWLSRQRLLLVLPLPILIGVAFCYFAFVFYPAAASTSTLHRARFEQADFLLDMNRAPADRSIRDPYRFLTTRVIGPLEHALREDAGNIRTEVALAAWYLHRWALAPFQQDSPTDAERAIARAVQAQQTCPEGPFGYRAEYEARMQIATRLRLIAKQLEEEAKKDKKLTAEARKRNEEVAAGLEPRARAQCDHAARVIRAYLPKAPNDPEVHFLLAAALFGAGQKAEARAQAAEAHRLDELARTQHTLSDPQRDQLKRWLSEKAER